MTLLGAWVPPAVLTAEEQIRADWGVSELARPPEHVHIVAWATCAKGSERTDSIGQERLFCDSCSETLGVSTDAAKDV